MSEHHDPAAERDIYPDALRAIALMVVVFGHWLATLPRLEEGRVIATDHLLNLWHLAGALTWVVQIVPLFVFVSAAVSAEGVVRRLAQGHSQMQWWGGRALQMARPTVTYMVALTLLAGVALYTGGRLLGPFNQSLTIHLWFLVMLLTVQALLPLSIRADRRFGLGAVASLVILAALIDITRAGAWLPQTWPNLGERVMAAGDAIGWINAFVVWLLPQQLGIAWKHKRFSGAWIGLGLTVLGLTWLALSVKSGYPVAMIGFDLEGNSNMLPPTLALMGVIWLQVGLVLLCERPARWLLGHSRTAAVVGYLGALGMPLYLWHKLAELPAAWVGERLGAPIDAGDPGEPGFWLGRLIWIALCIAMVMPVLAAVVWIEMQRRPKVPHTDKVLPILAGGFALFVGLAVSLILGALPGALIGLAGVLAASYLLRAHP